MTQGKADIRTKEQTGKVKRHEPDPRGREPAPEEAPRDEGGKEQLKRTDLTPPEMILESPSRPESINHAPYQDISVDVHLLTPKGDKVGLEEAIWVRSPYPHAFHDSTILLGVAPGHYYLQATSTAEQLCALVKTSLHSQFYKTAPPTAAEEPVYFFGTTRVTRNQARSATRLKAIEANNKVENIGTRKFYPHPKPRGGRRRHDTQEGHGRPRTHLRAGRGITG